MADANGSLRAVIAARYDYLVAHLGRRLRSNDLAQDALHDIYLQLEKGKEVASVSNPIGFLLTAAMNRARNRQKADKRLASIAEIETTFNLVDDAPTPAEVAEARSEYQVFEKAFAGLPPRRRAIFLASLKGELSSQEIAKRIGLSKRRVDVELKLAREHCARALLKIRAK